MSDTQNKRDYRIQRTIEITIGTITWLTVTMPIWASFLIPIPMAYFIIVMCIYWFYKSLNYSASAILGYIRLKKDEKINWLSKAKRLKDFEKVKHIVVIPNYKEDEEKLAVTLDYLTRSTLDSKKHLIVVLGMEEREGEIAHQKAENLVKRYKNQFAVIIPSYHPQIPGEVAGKSSNQAWAGKRIKEVVVDQMGMDINYLTISSCDADSLFPPQYFACLSYKFLTNESRYLRFWQAHISEYANLDRTILPIKLICAINGVIRMSYSLQGDFFIPYTTYSLSLKLLDDVGYWDVDIIPEDWHMFFKAFYAKDGTVKTEAINQTIHGDAIEGDNFIDALKNRYEQNRRHAWGVTDIPYIIRKFMENPTKNFWKKIYIFIRVYESHFLWPTSWFLLTLGVNLPPIINPRLKETVLGYNYAIFSRRILSVTFIFTLSFIILDRLARPKKDFGETWLEKIVSTLQWLLMPWITLFLSTIPGLDAHTRLMFNKKIEYIVAPKKVGKKEEELQLPNS